MPKIPAPTEGDYPELPEKEWFEVEVLSVTPFMDDKFPNKDGSPKPSFQFIFVPVAEEFESSKIWARGSQSWASKPEASNLRKIAQATFAADLPDEELYEVDTDDLVGKHLLLMGEYKDGDRRYLKPTDYKRVAKAKASAASTRTASKPAPAAKAAPKAKESDDIDI